MEYFKQFKTRITNNDLPSTVNLWEEYCLCDEIDPEELCYILEELKSSSLSDSFGIYVDQIFPLWENLPDSLIKHTIFKLIIDIQTTNSAALAEKTILYLQNYFGDSEEFANKLRLVGLREKENFQGAVSHFELLNHLKEHHFVFHTGGWGVGEIMDVSFIREEISLEFDYVAGLKDISFKNGFNTLIPISNDHFLARRFGTPDELEKQAKEDPVFVIKLLLKDLGPKTASEIKDELSDLVIPEDEWNKWWQNTRTKLKKDTMIENPKSIKSPFKLRKNEISHEQQLQKLLEKKPDLNALIEILYGFMRDFPAALKKAEFKSVLILQLNDLLNHKEITPTQELQLQFFLKDLSEDESHENTISQRIQEASDFLSLILDIQVIAFKKRLLTLVHQIRDDWAHIFLDLFLAPIQNPLRDYIMQQLIKAGKSEELNGKIEEMLHHPQHSPQAFLWYFSKVMESDSIAYADTKGKERFFETFFVLMYLLERNGDHRDLVKKMHSLLTDGRYAIVRTIFQTASIETVKELLLLATKCQILDDHDIKILNSLAEVVYPVLVQKTSYRDDGIENVIWTTEEGYLKIKERLHQIATVETVQNAKEIEVARGHGDLRENAEFKFALEKREQLQNELKLLSDQMNKMRIITIDDIATHTVGVGTAIKLENNRGEISTFTFLGPWDTDPDKNILSFNSKFAQALTGAKIGEQRQVQNEIWTVKEITSYLDQPGS